MKNLIIILLIFLSFQVFSQTKQNDKNYQKQLEYAKGLLLIEDYKNAYINLLELYQIDSTDTEVNYHLGFSSYYSNRDKSIALPYFIKGKSFDGNAYYFMALIYHQKEEFSLARKSFNEYKSQNINGKLFPSIEVSKQLCKIDHAQDLIKTRTDLNLQIV